MVDFLSGLALVGMAIVFTVVLLGIGVFTGYRFGLQAREQHVPELGLPLPDAQLIEQLSICRELTARIQSQSLAVVELAQPHLQALPPVFSLALDGLVRATKQLTTQFDCLQAPGRPEPPSTDGPTVVHNRQKEQVTSEPPESDDAPATHEVSKLTGDELRSLTTMAGNPSSDHVQRSTRRFPYDCHQTVHAWYDNEDEAVSPGTLVRCRDLCVQGVGFFWPDKPDFERVIIALGSEDDPIYMAAEIIQHKAVVMHGEACYLVGCQFIGRVPGFSEEARVQRNRRRSWQSLCDVADSAGATIA